MSGLNGIPIKSVAYDTDPGLSAADQQNVSSLLWGAAWNTTTLTYSFPTASSNYGTQASYGETVPFVGFGIMTPTQRAEVVRILGLVTSYTGLTFTNITESDSVHATLRFANSSSLATGESHGPGATARSGDSFNGGSGQHPAIGNFDSAQAIMFNIGEALGLTPGDGNSLYGAMNLNRYDIEYSVLSNPSFIGSTQGATSNSYPSTFMMYDIAALQHIYGANFSNVGLNITYTWSGSGEEFINGVGQGVPANGTIFSTLWTGGSTSTVDLSNYNQDQADDMNPGGYLIFSAGQKAHLDFFSISNADTHIAQANVRNALLYNGDTRSLLDNMTTGSGNDEVWTNAVNNVVNTGLGNDAITGSAGNDTIIGGGGTDSVYYNTLVTTGIVAIIQAGNGTVNKGGANGADTLSSVETILGSTGNDVFYVDNSETVFGGGGFDYLIELTPSVNLVNGPAGNFLGIDEVVCNTGNNVINISGSETHQMFLYGSTGNDTLTLGQGGGFAFGGGGTNILTGCTTTANSGVAPATNFLVDSGGTNVMNGGAGTAVNYFYANPGDTIHGAGAFNVLVELSSGVSINGLGTSGLQEVVLNGGTNTVTGVGSSSFLYLYGGAGNDTMTLGSGGGYLFGEGGTNVLNGGTGGTNVFVGGGGGSNTMNGGTGTSSNVYFIDDLASVHGAGAFNTVIELTQSVSRVLGSGPLASNVQELVLNGGTNSADFSVAAGTVYLYGGGGNDTLKGGSGNDFLYGGLGSNTFKVGVSWGRDTVMDWTAGTNNHIDMTALAGAGVHSMASLTIAVTGGNDVISFGGNSLTLSGFGGTLVTGNFVFA